MVAVSAAGQPHLSDRGCSRNDQCRTVPRDAKSHVPWHPGNTQRRLVNNAEYSCPGCAGGLFLLMNNIFMPYEENSMRNLFGQNYGRYEASVRKWL
jgi:hypothetical protein